MAVTADQPHLAARWGRLALAGAALVLAAALAIPQSGGSAQPAPARPVLVPVRAAPVRVIGTLIVNAAGPDRRAGREIELPDARISLVDDGGNRAGQAVTQLDGRFEVRAPRPGRYRLCYEVGPLRDCGQVVTAGAGTTLMQQVPVSARSFVHGQVLTRDGRPCWVADSFFGLDVSTRVSAATAQTRANVQGEYALFGLAPGRHEITARCEAASIAGLVSLGAGPAAHDLTLPNRAPVVRTAAALTGNRRVLRAAPGATVTLRADTVDPDGDAVQYIWRTQDGSNPVAASGGTANWQLGPREGLRSVYVMARDGRGGFAYRRIDLEGARSDRVSASGRVVDETTGAPVRGAAVSFGSARGETDANGWFQIASDRREDDRYVLNIRHADFALTSRILERSARGDRYEMTPVQAQTTPAGTRIRLLDRTSGGQCGNAANRAMRPALRRARPRLLQPALADAGRPPSGAELLAAIRATAPRCMERGAEVALPAGALVDARGAAAAGPVRTTVATLNPSRRTLPGDYSALPRGGGGGALLSYGAVDVRFTNAAGRPLNLRPGVAAEIRMPVGEGQLAAAPATMKMWSYDEERGRWVEEGLARLVRTAEGAFYVGETRHFSTINMDIELNPANATCVRFQVSPAFGPWAPLTLRAYVTYNGTQSQVAETVLDASSDHSIRALPYAPGNTLRLELSGTANGVTQVLLDDVIQLGPPRPRMTGNVLFPPAPYTECDDAGTLSPPAEVIPFYGINDATGRPVFLTGPFGALNPQTPQGAAYYQAIAGSKPTLGAWWAANGFGNAGQGGTRASYMNHNDLGFGRDMHCIEPGGGRLACYVTNYGLPDQNPQNANDAMSQNAATRAATVAMEYDPNAANNTNVQFFVYNGGDAGSTLLEFADLDGLGPKPVPHLCMVCHGGDFTGGVVRFARFREFDLPSFRYAGGAAWDFGQAAVPNGLDATAFATLNRMVHDAHDAPFFTPIADLIDRWYPNGFGANLPQDPNPVPPGWASDPTVYRSVYARSCRTCHIAQDRADTAVNPVFDTAPSLKSTGFYVCGGSAPKLRRMPNAFITYRNFWADTARAQLYQGFITPADLNCGT